MVDAIKDNLLAVEFHPQQEYFWRSANEIFDWCRVRFKAATEKLDVDSRKQLVAGKIPRALVNVAKAEVSERLSTHLDFFDHHEVVKAALPKVPSAKVNRQASVAWRLRQATG